MKRLRHAQALDRSDPKVAAFTAECGLTQHAVSIRLIGVTFDDVQTQVRRLESSFGLLVQMTQPRQSGRGQEWIAYGTIIG
jgi:hypothetical protein